MSTIFEQTRHVLYNTIFRHNTEMRSFTGHYILCKVVSKHYFYHPVAARQFDFASRHYPYIELQSHVTIFATPMFSTPKQSERSVSKHEAYGKCISRQYSFILYCLTEHRSLQYDDVPLSMKLGVHQEVKRSTNLEPELNAYIRDLHVLSFGVITAHFHYQVLLCGSELKLSYRASNFRYRQLKPFC